MIGSVRGSRKLNQAIAIKIQRWLYASGQHNIALFGNNNAIIANMWRHQRHQSFGFNGRHFCSVAGIFLQFNFGVMAATTHIEMILPVGVIHEVIVVYIAGAHNQTADIHFRGAAKHHAALVNQPDVGVSFQCSVKLSHLTIRHAVQGNTAIRLLKLNRAIRRGIKRLPVDDHFIACLIHF